MSVHDLPFERLVDLSELATGRTPQRYDVFAGALSPPPIPVRWLASTGIERAGDIQYRAMLPTVSVYALPGHVLGRGGAARGDSVFWRDDCHPGPLREVFDGAAGTFRDWAGAINDPAAEIVDLDHPIACVLHPNTGRAQALIEVLPRLWLLDQLARMSRPFAVAVDTGAPAWLVELVGTLVPPERVVRFDGQYQVLRAAAVVVPSMMQLDEYLHPAFNLMAETVLDRVLGAGPRPDASRRLFLAREGALGVANAAALEERLATAGFEVLRPHAMSFADQVRACAGARTIVSEYGPASLNALFAPVGSAHVTLNPVDPLLERVGAARGQQIGVVEPEGGMVARVGGAAAAAGPVDVEAVMRLIERMQAGPTGHAAAARPARLTVAVARETIATGLYVAGLTDIGEPPVLAEAARVTLPMFLHADAVDPALSPYARMFHQPGPHAYDAQAVLCGRLGGASLLGDSGLALWRGRLVADSVDSGDFTRAAGITLAVGDDGRPVAAPLDRRSHPGRALFAAFTGRWSDEAGFLAECLPRLVAFTRLVASGAALTACVPASPPGSIQSRALELLGIDAPATIAPDQVATGSQLWLPSRIDPWTASPLVVEAAAALAALVPAARDATPKRLYLRAQAGSRPPLAEFDAFAELLDQHGFIAVTLADHDLDTRIQLMRGAAAVVGEAAGGLAHVAFCEPGTRVLELFNPASVQPPHYVLAGLAHLAYGFLVGQHVAEPGYEAPSLASRYTIAPERLASALEDLLRPFPLAEAPVTLPGALPLDPARRLDLPRPFFAAPGLPHLALEAAATRMVPHAGLALDGHGGLGPAGARATEVGGHLVATLAPDGDDPLLGALPRLLAARVVRELHPAARVVVPPSGPARRIAELLGFSDHMEVLAPEAAITAETLWTVDGVEPATDHLPSDLLRRCGDAMRGAVPPIDAEAMGLLPSRLHLCASAPDPTLERAVSPRAFVPVAWPTLSIDEQVRLMRGATLVLVEPGMAGALVLATPGTRVLEAGRPTARALAAACGLPYGCVGDAAQLGAAVEALVA